MFYPPNNFCGTSSNLLQLKEESGHPALVHGDISSVSPSHSPWLQTPFAIQPSYRLWFRVCCSHLQRCRACSAICSHSWLAAGLLHSCTFMWGNEAASQPWLFSLTCNCCSIVRAEGHGALGLMDGQMCSQDTSAWASGCSGGFAGSCRGKIREEATLTPH